MVGNMCGQAQNIYNASFLLHALCVQVLLINFQSMKDVAPYHPHKQTLWLVWNMHGYDNKGCIL